MAEEKAWADLNAKTVAEDERQVRWKDPEQSVFYSVDKVWRAKLRTSATNKLAQRAKWV